MRAQSESKHGGEGSVRNGKLSYSQPSHEPDSVLLGEPL